jgi:hypothetical protein
MAEARLSSALGLKVIATGEGAGFFGLPSLGVGKPATTRSL